MHEIELKGILNKKGFTAIELTIAITILTIVLGVFLEFASKNYFMATKEAVNAELNQEASVATEKIVGDMRKATNADVDPTTTGIFLYPSADAGIITANEILTLPNSNNPTDFVVIRYETPTPGTYTTVCYRKNNNALIRYLLADSPTGEVPTNQDKVDTVIGSLDASNSKNDASNKDKRVEEFSVELVSNTAADNFRKYNIRLKLTQGAGNYKTEVVHEVPFIKMKTPN